MLLLICFLFSSQFILTISYSLSANRARVIPRYNAFDSLLKAIKVSESNQFPGTDLTGYKMLCTFNGFGVENMTCGIELKEKFEVQYSLGISSEGPGFWRIVKYDDGKEVIEATQPIGPTYMFLFELWESPIIWRGDIDLKNMKILNGEAITTKKRFGLFPYNERIATFEATLLSPGMKFPDIRVPRISDIQWTVRKL